MKNYIKKNIYFVSFTVFTLIFLFSVADNNMVSVTFSQYSISFPPLIYLLFIINLFIFIKEKQFTIKSKNQKMLTIGSLLTIIFVTLLIKFVYRAFSIQSILVHLLIEFLYPAIVEEFYFRKVLIKIISIKSHSNVMTNMLQALVFVIFHCISRPIYLFQITPLLILFIVALGLGLLYSITNSIVVSSLAHALYNFVVKFLI